MHITVKETKETIQVLHNNQEEMMQTVATLKSEGWSSNTRISIAGDSLIKYEIPTNSVETFQQSYPDVEVQYPSKNDYLYRSPYVFITEHERVIKREEGQ